MQIIHQLKIVTNNQNQTMTNQQEITKEQTGDTIQFMSPPAVTKISRTTPQTINNSTRTVNSTKLKQYNKDLLNLELYKHGKLIPQEKVRDTALKMSQKLAKLNFRDTGFLSNATTEGKNSIIALSMYYRHRRFDSSNKFRAEYRKTRPFYKSMETLPRRK